MTIEITVKQDQAWHPGDPKFPDSHAKTWMWERPELILDLQADPTFWKNVWEIWARPAGSGEEFRLFAQNPFPGSSVPKMVEEMFALWEPLEEELPWQPL